MKKLTLIVSMLLLFFTAYAQNDTPKLDTSIKVYSNVENQHLKDVLTAKSPSIEILIINGDSLYNMINPREFKNKIEADNRSFRIIQNPDSIQKIITSKIKSLIIVTKAE